MKKKVIFKLKWLNVFVFSFRRFFIEESEIILKVFPGLIILLFLHSLESTVWWEGVLNSTYDRFIQMDAKKTVKADADTSDIFLVDIWNQAQKHQKRKIDKQKASYLSPRDEIAGLIEMACKGGAKIIVLDFLFEENDCCHPERDARMCQVLKENKTQVKVIFPVRVGHKNELIPLIFDNEINDNPNYFRAIPTILASQTDSTVRYWKAFQRYDKNRVLWSIPVLSAALNAGKMDELKKIEHEISNKVKRIDFYTIELNREKGIKILLPVDNQDLYIQRTRYRLIPKDCIVSHPEGNLILPTIEHLMPKRFKNKIVIIGNSNPDVGDIYSTPVGPMNGMFIHGNSIYTLMQGLQHRRASRLISLLINTFIVIGAAYLLYKLDSIWADLLGMILGFLIFCFMIYFCLFLDLKIFPNFALSIVAIGFMDTIYTLREIIAKRKNKSRTMEKAK